LGVFALPAPEKTVKPLDMKDKHNFNIYLHELAHKINQINKNDSFRSIC
jgi:Mlc titration factor MtfA (ptsG expression regulator)